MSGWLGKHSLMTLFLMVLSALLLGISQPLYMPILFGDVGPEQSIFGLLAFIGYAPLFLAIAHRDLKSTFLITFVTMTLQYTIVLYWIYVALHVHGHVPSISASLITLLLPMLMALKGGLFFTLGRFLSERFNISFFIIAPLSLCTLEYFRNYYIFGGFPWGNAGYSVGRVDQILQLASLIGVYGLVFLVGLVNALIAIAWERRASSKAYRYLASAAFLVIGAFIYGQMRLKGSANEFAPSIRVALLQGNIPQEIKSRGNLHADDILTIYMNLVREAKKEGAQLVIWPESSYPKTQGYDVKSLGFSYEDRVASVIGAVTFGEEADGEGYYVGNSALFLDYDGKVVKRYDKSHLVPFGEYVPWPMKGIVGRVVPGIGAFKPGTKFIPENLEISREKSVRIGATVCYEGIFPEISRTYAKNGAQLLVNITNDAWYGRTSAPYQHLLMYKVRSVETGLPFLRATNSGISAWFDPFGREHKNTALFERELVVDNVPLLKKATVYVMFGDVIPITCLLILVIAYVAAVLPVHLYIRQRQWWKIAIIIGLSLVGVMANVYYEGPRFITDESANTKILLTYLMCLLLMIGLLSKTRRSRSILFASSIAIVFCSIALSIFESSHFLLGLIFGLLIYLLAFRIKESDQPIK